MAEPKYKKTCETCILNPFTDEQIPVEIIYNKQFRGINFAPIAKISNCYRKTHSPEIRDSIIEILGNSDKADMFINAFVEDIDISTGKIKKYSTLASGEDVAELRQSAELLIEKFNEIRGLF